MSKFVTNGKDIHASRLVKAFEEGLEQLKDFNVKPEGVFNSRAKVTCGNVTINSAELDLEFTVPFDDDLEPNEAEIILYNLTSDTIENFKYHSKISIEAGYEGDTGVIFSGYVEKVTTARDGVDKVTTIKCLDDISKNDLNEITYGAGTKASKILKDLLDKTGTPIAVFKMRRDHTYENEVKIDGDLRENIKKYSEVCGVSTYVNKGKLYSRYIKEGDHTYFIVSEETGLIGSPSAYTEEQTAEDYTDIINGYELELLLQHRITAGAIVTLKSMDTTGEFRACSGEHRFNPEECITKVKVY